MSNLIFLLIKYSIFTLLAVLLIFLEFYVFKKILTEDINLLHKTFLFVLPAVLLTAFYYIMSFINYAGEFILL